MKHIEKRVRVQLFDTDFNQVEDKLVNQDTLFRKGPTEKWEGPMKIEVSLFTQEDITDFKVFLDMLIGNLPVVSKRERKRTKRLSSSSPDYRAQLIEQAEATEDIVAFLKEEGFLFTSLEFLQDLGNPIMAPDVGEHTAWMVKRTKKAKNPLNHKYDISLLVGIRSTGSRTKKTKFYFVSGEEVLKEISKSSEQKGIKVPARYKMKFPHYLTPQERLKIRIEIGELREDETVSPSPLYKRWVWAIAKENEEKDFTFPRIESIVNPFE